jgi:hypothetical protein
MNMPGFTAEASFFKSQHYRKTNGGPRLADHLVRPSLYRVGGWDTDLNFICYQNCRARGGSDNACTSQCTYQVFDPTSGTSSTVKLHV